MIPIIDKPDLVISFFAGALCSVVVFCSFPYEAMRGLYLRLLTENFRHFRSGFRKKRPSPRELPVKKRTPSSSLSTIPIRFGNFTVDFLKRFPPPEKPPVFWERVLFEILQVLFYASVAGLSVFVAVFAVANFIAVNFPLQLEQLMEGSEQNVLPLRFASVLLGSSVCMTIFRIIFPSKNPTKPSQKKMDIASEFNGLKASLDPEHINWMIIGQLGFYVIIIAALWLFALDEYYTITVGILSWAVLFIQDDWVVMSAYARLLKGRVIRSQKRKIYLFNFLLLVLLVPNLYLYAGLAFTILMVLTTLLSLAFRHIEEWLKIYGFRHIFLIGFWLNLRDMIYTWFPDRYKKTVREMKTFLSKKAKNEKDKNEECENESIDNTDGLSLLMRNTPFIKGKEENED